jgi:hypothetical protein
MGLTLQFQSVQGSGLVGDFGAFRDSRIMETIIFRDEGE